MLRKILCKHNDVEFIRNIYGDEINQLSGKNIVRSIWRCKNCGRIIYSCDEIKKDWPYHSDVEKVR